MQSALERLAGRAERTPPRGMASVPEPAPAEPGSTFRSWMLVPLLVILAAAIAIVGGIALGRLQLGGPLGVRAAPKTGGGAGKAAAIAITAAKDFDPGGDDGSEDPADVHLAIDGNPATAWTTEHYNSAAFGNLKDGVGLWVDLGRTVRVSRVAVTSPLPGWTFQLKAGTLPDRLSGPLSDSHGATTFQVGSGGSVTVDLRRTKARGVLIWITHLAPDHSGRFAAAIGEVSVTGIG